MTAPVSETLLQRTIDAAMQGDVDAFQTLRKLSAKHKAVLGRVLPVISHHLAVSCLEAGGHEGEALAIIALNAISINASRDQMKEFMLKNATDILNWICTLFNAWVFDVDQPELQTLPASDRVENLRAQLVDSVILILCNMTQSGYLDHQLCHAIYNHDRLGDLLYQLTLVSCRDHQGAHVAMMRCCGLVRHGLKTAAQNCKCASYRLAPSNKPRWESLFYQQLEHKPYLYAKAIASRIVGYALAPHTRADEVSSLLSDLLDIIHDHPILMDACLDQEEVTRYIAIIVILMIRYLESGEFEHPIRLEAYRTIAYAAQFFGSAIYRGGPIFVSIAIILPALLTLCHDRVVDVDESGSKHVQNMEESLVSMLHRFTPFVVYPYVFRNVRKFSNQLRIKATADMPSPILDKLDNALQILGRRIDEELTITGHIKRNHRTQSEYVDPTKFCDNYECPFPGNVAKLGRCLACRSGYYCSRECQKAVWKRAHRDECRRIVSAGRPQGLTIHDRECLRRSLFFRYLYHSKNTKPLPNSEKIESLTERSIVEINMCDPTVSLYIHNSSGELDITLNGGSGMGPLVRARFPTTCGEYKEHMEFEALLGELVTTDRGVL